MSSLGSPNPFFIAGKKAYEIKRSLRFNDDDSAHLSRTPSSAGNRKTFTWSAWIKKGELGATQGRCFGGGVSGSDYFEIYFPSDDGLRVIWYQGGQTLTTTTAKFRDPSAWYHFVVAVDTTQSTAGDRIKMYRNNVLLERDSTNPSQNLDTSVNNTVEHNIGKYLTGGASYFDGYMAEINFVDGNAYDPSYFGETNVLTGQWNPKKYIGSYGTNGFYLNFSDNSGTTATTLGKDSSGNGNNFTPNNFSVSAGEGNDSVEDTPTNNFCTLNPLFMNGNETAGTFSEGNLKLVTTGYEYGTALATFSIRYGKYYWEVKQLGGSIGIHGIVRGSNPHRDVYVSYDPDGNLFGFGYQNNGSIKGTAGTGTTTNANLATGLATYTTNDIIGFASDISNGTLAIYKNNTLIYTITGINDDDWIPAISGYTSDGSYSINFGQQAFSYTPPTGYKKLNSANLPDPTIKLPNKHFDTLLWSGDGTANRAITGLDFQPDWVWLKSRTNSDYHQRHDSNRGASAGALFHVSAAEDPNYPLDSFDSNGFTTSEAGDQQNTSGQNYVAWNWDAGETDGKTYTVTVVSDSGNKYRFDGFGTSAVTLDLAEGGTYVFNYPSAHPFRFSTTSDGTHGGGSEYTTGVTVISSTSIQIVVAASAPTLYYYCSSHSGMGGAINTNSTLGSSNFDGNLQSVTKVNAIAGFSIVKWTSGGNLYKTVGHGLGVKPDIVILKSRTTSNNWFVYFDVVDGTNDFMELSATNASLNAESYSIVPPTSTVFGTDGAFVSGSSNIPHIAYVFSSVSAYSKVGKYTGNQNANGTFVFTGFRPALVITKGTWGGNWNMYDNKRNSYNVANKTLYPNLANAESTESSSGNQMDLLSNGFKLRGSDNDTNHSAGFIYLAFAESPFKNARAR
jgi:hypothetical protein